MKACESCQRLFGDDAGFCPIDGRGLRPSHEVEVPPDPSDPRIGKRICADRYEVRRIVADGGMGRVYQALDLRVGRSVALKVLHTEVALDDVAVERFKREFSLSAELPHEHIVEVLDFMRTEDGSVALVMEYLEGEELRMLLKREGVMAPARTIRMVAQLARGLEPVHRQRIVHRDIKPDNIFLCHTPEGDHVKLLDFGSVRDNTEGAKKLTVIGTTIGSPYYMSPEQAQGLRALDHRADVWSVAAIAYECLTGRLPFGGKSGPAILLAILGQEPMPPTIAAGDRVLPAALDDVLAAALAKDMNCRIGALGEFADRLGAAFGLPGDHERWLATPERTLAAAIEQAMAQAPEPVERVTAPALPTSQRPAAAPEPERAPGADADDDEAAMRAMGVPQGPPWGAIVAVGVLLLAIGVAVAAYLLG